MKLFINTTDREKIVVGIDGKQYEKACLNNKPQELLSFIYECLKKQKKEFKDVTYVEVDMGPGSFTGIRVGLSVGMAIGFVLDVPVNGKDPKKEAIPIVYE